MLDQSSEVPVACSASEGVGLVAADENLDDMESQLEPELRCRCTIGTLRIQSVGGVLMRSVAEAQKTVSSPRGLDDAFCGVRGLRLVRHFVPPRT